MMIFVFLPVLFFLLLFCIIYSRLSHTDSIHTRIRKALITAVIVQCLFIVLITESLSFFKLIDFTRFTIAWSISTLTLLYYTTRKKIFFSTFKETLPSVFILITKSRILAVILFFLIISFGIAVLYPPNNYDSMTYHMARVAHWQQNHSISHYQTHILRQLIYQPFAEWIILHLQILTSSDRFANGIQTFFFASCIVCASLLTKELGGNVRQQKLAMLFTCLIPIAIIESNTTQNDIVVAFFLLCFIYFSILTFKKWSLLFIALSGISLGLAWLTKGTGYLFSVLFCVWHIIFLIKDYRLPFNRLLKKGFLLALIPFIAFLINNGHYYRNTFLTGSALGKANQGTGNEAFALKPILLVSLKNMMNHLPVTGGMKREVERKAIEAGIDPNDPNYSFITMDWMMEGFSFDEDYAQNFIHFLLIIAVGLFFAFRKRLYKEPINYYVLFTFSVYATAVLFCIALKWQPWSNRLETPLFMMFCIIIAMEINCAKKWLQIICYLPMLGFGLAALFWNAKHPLMPPSKNIFNQSYSSFIYAKGLIDCRNYLLNTSYRKLGIVIGADSWDYPFYKLLGKVNGKKFTLKHVLVNNESSIYLDMFVPDAIVSTESSWEMRTINGKAYYKTRTFEDGFTLYEPK